MIPISLTLEGIGPYADKITLNYCDLQSPAALVASYGTGKTWLMEGLLLALYGSAAWYQGSIYDCLTQGGDGEGRIELRFSHSAHEYRAVRELRDTGKTKSQKSMLMCDGNLVAGPKTSDFDRAMFSLLGIDKETFLATAFLSQNRANDLCGQPGEQDLVARRRAVFNELIGATSLDAIEEKAAKAANEKDAVARELEAQLAGEPDYQAQIEQIDAGMLQSVRARIEAMNAQTLERLRLDNLRAKLADAHAGEDEIRSIVADHQRAVKQADAARDRAEALSVECERLEPRASGVERAQGEVEQLTEALAEREKLQGELAVWELWEAWLREDARLRDAETAARKLVMELQRIPGVDAETQALAKKFETFSDEFERIIKLNEVLRADNRNDEKRNDFYAEIRMLESQIKAVSLRMERKPETPFGEKCAPCPLLREYANLPAEREALSQRLEAVREALDDVDENQELLEISEPLRRVEAARAAADQVRLADAQAERLENACTAHAVVQSLIRGNIPPDQPEADDPRPALAKVQAAIDVLAGAHERLASCTQARADLERKRLERDSASAELEAAIAEVERLTDAAAAARVAIAERIKACAKLEADIKQFEYNLSVYAQEIERLAREIARAEAQTEALECRQADGLLKRERVGKMRLEIEALRQLRTIFGPRGVRQILIDAAAPELEDIADALFERATGGRMRLRIATQTLNADGSTREDFQILVRDSRGERDALRYSGGQLQLIQILFRIAVALWIGRIRGHKAECLFLDEAFDRLGAEGTEDLLRVLEYLQDQVALIVVVTHDPLIADRCASQVRLVKQGGAVRIAQEPAQ